MANTKISQLPSATTPVVGTEVLPIVQSSATTKVSIANLTAGRAVTAASYDVTGAIPPTNGMYLSTANTVNISIAGVKAASFLSDGDFDVGTSRPNNGVRYIQATNVNTGVNAYTSVTARSDVQFASLQAFSSTYPIISGSIVRAGKAALYAAGGTGSSGLHIWDNSNAPEIQFIIGPSTVAGTVNFQGNWELAQQSFAGQTYARVNNTSTNASAQARLMAQSDKAVASTSALPSTSSLSTFAGKSLFYGTNVSGQTASGTVVADFSTGTNQIQFYVGTSASPVLAGTINSSAVLTLTNTPIMSAGTVNGVAYLNGAKQLTTGSALTFTGSSLGVNVSSPTYTLDLQGAPVGGAIVQIRDSSATGANQTFGGLLFNSGYGTDFSIGKNTDSATGTLQIRSGTSTVLANLNDSGNLLLTNPLAGSRFVRVGNTDAGTDSSASFWASSDTGNLTMYSHSSTASGTAGFSGVYGVSTNGTYIWDASTNAKITFNLGTGTQAATEKMRLTSTGLEVKQSQLIGYSSFAGIGTNGLAVAGNLGIGTSSPASKLHIESASAESFRIGYSSTKTSRLGTTSAGDLQIYAYDSAVGYKNILLAIDSGTSAGNVGIGTSSPAYKLDVAGTTRLGAGNAAILAGVGGAFAGGQGELYTISTNNLGIGTTGAAALRFYTNSVLNATLDSSGNLGLGVTPSASNACTNIELPFGATLSARSNTAAPQFAMMSNAVGNWYEATYKINGFATQYTQQGFDGTHKWYTASSGFAGNAISFTQAMTLDASGRLGIGTTSPDQKLHIAVSSATAIYNRIQNSVGNCYLGLLSDGNTVLSADNAGNELIFNTGAIPRARIDSSGNLLVGITNLDPTFNRTNGIALRATGSVLSRSAGGSDFGVSTTSGINISFYTDNGSSRVTAGNISSSGSVTLYNASSDYRLKTVIGPVANAGQRIDALEPVEYTWNADGSRTRGFLAHQFQEVYAGSVSGTKDAVDAEGKPVYQSMQASSSEVIADLVAEIQSLRKRLLALESN